MDKVVVLFMICLLMAPHAAIAQTSGKEFHSQFLVPHNEARAKVGIPPLVWNATVANYAQAYANQRLGDCALQHSHGPYGENLFWGGAGGDWKPKDAVAAWVNESTFFNFGTHSCDDFPKCGHYSQVVWKNSQTVGCASVICNDGGSFITCNYYPPGNYIGEKPY